MDRICCFGSWSWPLAALHTCSEGKEIFWCEVSGKAWQNLVGSLLSINGMDLLLCRSLPCLEFSFLGLSRTTLRSEVDGMSRLRVRVLLATLGIYCWLLQMCGTYTVYPVHQAGCCHHRLCHRSWINCQATSLRRQAWRSPTGGSPATFLRISGESIDDT